jgi:hypothetical protein
MDSSTVLSHLAFRFTTHPENLATEALAFILNRSQSARAALTTIIRKFDFPCDEHHRFETQGSNDGGSRPDIVGKTQDGTPEIVVEVKFWAGLTDAQPTGYLGNLHGDGAILLFVAPGQRFETLWSELVRRCELAGLQHGEVSNPGKEMRCVSVGNHVLALISWPAVLGSMRGQAEVDGDGRTLADIAQLSGLSEQMDAEAFLPIGSEELTGTTGRRIIQFSQLVTSLKDVLVANQLVSVAGLSSASGQGYYGQYMLLNGFGAFLTFHARHWAEFGESPLWLKVTGQDWNASAVIPEVLTSAGIRWKEAEKYWAVPIFLTVGVERDSVVHDAVEQIKRVAMALETIKNEGVSPNLVQPKVDQESTQTDLLPEV